MVTYSKNNREKVLKNIDFINFFQISRQTDYQKFRTRGDICPVSSCPTTFTCCVAHDRQISDDKLCKAKNDKKK